MRAPPAGGRSGSRRHRAPVPFRAMSDTPGGAEPDAPYSLRHLAGVLWRGRWLIAAVTAAGTILVLIYLVLSLALPDDRNPLPNVYRAEALLLVPREGSSTFDAELSGLINRSSLSGLLPGAVNNMRLAITLLSSKSTVDAVVEEFDLVERYRITTQDFRGRVRNRFLAKAAFEQDFSNRTLRVSYRSTDPQFAADVVNRMVDLLKVRFDELGLDRSSANLKLIADRHKEVENRIAEYAERIRQFQELHGVLDVNDLAREYVRRIADLNTSLLLTEVEIQTYGEVAPDNDSALLVLREERDNLRELIDEMESGYQEYDGGQLPAQRDLPALAQEFARLRLEHTVQVEVFKLLSREHELAKLQVRGQEPAFQVLERAEVPDLRVGPQRRRILTAAFFASLGAGVLAVLFLNTIRGRSRR